MSTAFPRDVTLREWDSPLGEFIKRTCIDLTPYKPDIPWIVALMEIWELPEASAQ